MEPSVSVVFAYKNRDLSIVKNCLASLYTQSVEPDEVICVDMASKAIQSAKAKSLCHHFNARYIHCDDDPIPSGCEKYFRSVGVEHPVHNLLQNPTTALNIGIRHSTSTYIAKTANDIIFEQNFIENLKLFLEWFQAHGKRPQIFACTQQWEMPPEIPLNKISLPDNFEDLFAKSTMKRPQGQSSQIFSRRWIYKVHGFDERFRFNYDTDLWKRAKTDKLADWWCLSRTHHYFRSVKELVGMETRTLHQYHDTTRNGKVRMYGLHSDCYRNLLKWRDIYHDPKNYTAETIIRNGEDWGNLGGEKV